MIEETSIALAQDIKAKQEELISDAITLRCEDLVFEPGVQPTCRLRAECHNGVTRYYMDNFLILEMDDPEYEMCDGRLIGSWKYRIHCGG